MAETQQPGSLPTEQQREERKSSLLTDILTIIGFAILFIIIIWGLVHLVQLIASSLSPSQPAPAIRVSAPAQATSGEPVTISWSYSPGVSGSYAFLYECKDGLTFQTSPAKNSGIPCGVAYTVGSASSSLTLIPILPATSPVSDTVSIVFIPSKGSLPAGGQGSPVHGSATMTVIPAGKVVAAVKPAPVSKRYAGPRTFGPTDLSVRIISGSVDPTGTGVVTFDIANVGGSTSGSYTFSAQLPTAQPYPYVSPAQAPLAPGSHVISTLRFTDVAPGGGLFSVSVLDGNDANASNDYASTQLTAPYNYNNGYGYQQPYLQYPAPTYTY